MRTIKERIAFRDLRGVEVSFRLIDDVSSDGAHGFVRLGEGPPRVPRRGRRMPGLVLLHQADFRVTGGDRDPAQANVIRR